MTKCTLGVKDAEYLDYWINENGIIPQEAKIQAIHNRRKVGNLLKMGYVFLWIDTYFGHQAVKDNKNRIKRLKIADTKTETAAKRL